MRKEEDVDMWLYLVEYLAMLISPHPKETNKAITNRRKKLGSAAGVDGNSSSSIGFMRDIFKQGGEAAVKEIFGQDFQIPDSVKSPDAAATPANTLSDEDLQLVTDMYKGAEDHFSDEKMKDIFGAEAKQEKEEDIDNSIDIGSVRF